MSLEKDILEGPTKSASRIVGLDPGVTTCHAPGLGFAHLGIATTKVALLIDAQPAHTSAGAADRRPTRHDAHCHSGDNDGESNKSNEKNQSNTPQWQAATLSRCGARGQIGFEALRPTRPKAISLPAYKIDRKPLLFSEFQRRFRTQHT